LTTKVHAVVDGLGNPIRVQLTGGNVHDIVPACDLIAGLQTEQTIADKAYDADKFIALATEQGLVFSRYLGPRTGLGFGRI